MSKICILGSGSSIAKAMIRKLTSVNDIDIIVAGRNEEDDVFIDISEDHLEESLNRIPLDCDIYLITLGVLYPKRINEQKIVETYNSLTVNLVFPVKLIERLIDINQRARIIILGSESGIKGSYDTTYFLAKAALARYVKEKYIKFKEQQLVMVAPSVIEDSKMTLDREDLAEVYAASLELPKKRLLVTEEVVDLIWYLISADKGYINNEVININGGKFARMRYLDADD